MQTMSIKEKTFYNLIEKGQDAIQGILNVAKESDHPRGYDGIMVI